MPVQIGLVLAGRLALAVGRGVVLRVVHVLPDPIDHPVRVLGVDGFALPGDIRVADPASRRTTHDINATRDATGVRRIEGRTSRPAHWSPTTP